MQGPEVPQWIYNSFGPVAGAVLGFYLPKLMALRRQASSDAAARARDESLESKSYAEKDYFDQAINTLTVDRDKWKDTANEAWSILRKTEAQLARFTALQERHEKEISERDKQIDKLWRLVIKFAPKEMKPVLETEFARTQAGDLT